MSDFIIACLSTSAASSSPLEAAFAVFGAIWNFAQGSASSQDQLKVLTECIAHLLLVLNEEFRTGRLDEEGTTGPLSDLLRTLEKIRDFVQKQSSGGFVKSLIFSHQRLSEIEGYQKRVESSVAAFHISAEIRIQNWQANADQARERDQNVLHNRLRNLEANQGLLLEALNFNQNNALAIMASLKRRIDERSGVPRELEFYSSAYRAVATASGHQEGFHLEPWTISSLDVEFGPLVGGGGFGKVFKGRWNHLTVALKVMKGVAGAIPQRDTIEREIKVWSKLRHPHILQFLGANVLDDEPFIVMPFIRQGNARNYIQDNPDCDRLKILHHVALGLVYLHSNSVIHGDIKGVNILIDEAEKALLCDFGLTRIKADVNSRSASDSQAGILLGSRNWMAPELLYGGIPRKPCDIYSFGMTIYEIYTAEIPLGHILPGEFRELVVKQDIRPERPDEDEAPQLTDEVWETAERCWLKDPSQRLQAGALCQTLSDIVQVLSSHLRRASQLSQMSSSRRASQSSQISSTSYLQRTSSQATSVSHSRRTSQMVQSPYDHGPLFPAAAESSFLTSTARMPHDGQPSALSIVPVAYPDIQEIQRTSPTTDVLGRMPTFPTSPSSSRLSALSQSPTLSRSPTSPKLPISPKSSSSGSSSGSSSISGFFRRTLSVKQGIDLFTRAYSRVLSLEHPDDITCAAFSSDGKFLASGTSSGFLVKWNVDQGVMDSVRNVDTLLLHSDGSIRITSIMAGSVDNIVYGTERGDMVYEVHAPAKSESLIETKFKPGSVLAVRIPAAGSSLKDSVSFFGLRFHAYTADGYVWSWHHESPEFTMAMKPKLTHRRGVKCALAGSKVTSVTFDAAGDNIATGHSDGSIIVSKVATGQQASSRSHFAPPIVDTRSQGAHAKQKPAVRSLAFSPNGKKLAAAYLSREIRLWNVSTGESTFLRDPDLLAEPLYSPIPMCFYSDGKRIAYPSYNSVDSEAANGLVLHDVSSTAVMDHFSFEEGPISTGEVQNILASPCGKKLVVAFSGAVAVVWIWDK